MRREIAITDTDWHLLGEQLAARIPSTPVASCELPVQPLQEAHVDAWRDHTNAEFTFWFNLECEIDDKKSEVSKWLGMPEPEPIAANLKKQELISLRKDLAVLEARYKEPEPAPVKPASDAAATETLDFDMLATRQQLINAFGSFTGMTAAWFVSLRDTPALLAARKVAGTGGNHSTEPLFCPYEVMNWLIDPKRRKGRKVSGDTAWRMLKTHFPRVFARYSIGDTCTA